MMLCENPKHENHQNSQTETNLTNTGEDRNESSY